MASFLPIEYNPFAPDRFADFRRSDNVEDRRHQPVTGEMRLAAMLQAKGMLQAPSVGAGPTTEWLNNYDLSNRGTPITDLQVAAGVPELQDMAIKAQGAHLNDMTSRGREIPPNVQFVPIDHDPFN